AAAQALGQLGTAAAATELERLVGDKDAVVAQTALMTLAQTEPARAARIAGNALRAPEPAKRRQAVGTASALEPDRARPLLLTALHDADPTIVETAARTLAQVGGADAQRALVDLLTQSATARSVKRAAAEALTDIGGATLERYRDLVN